MFTLVLSTRAPCLGIKCEHRLRPGSVDLTMTVLTESVER